MMKKLVLFVLLFAATPVFAAEDVELSWTKGLAFVPGAFFTKSPSQVVSEQRLPVLIYMHGCDGINYNHDTQWAREIAKQNFIVVMPNSLARPGRLSDCNTRLKGPSNIFPQAYEYRQQEISYAIEQLRTSPWADQNNIFLMGHSEGGIATAQSTHGAWNAQIISGWTCTSGVSDFGGIHSPKHIPVLAIAYLDDVWRKGKTNEGRCIDHANDHDVTQIDLKGSDHETYSSPVARQAVIQFLKEHLKK